MCLQKQQATRFQLSFNLLSCLAPMLIHNFYFAELHFGQPLLPVPPLVAFEKRGKRLQTFAHLRAEEKVECQQHPVFPGGHPSKY